jgi:hypothetical protein
MTNTLFAAGNTFAELLGATGTSITAMGLAGRFTVAALCAFFILIIYKITYSGVGFSRSFAVSIVMTTVVTAAILMVINSNLALSLGMVGALSIIRFRSAIKDPRDIGFLFWAVAAGLTAGTGFYVIALFLSIFMAALLLVMRFFPIDGNKYMLIIRSEPEQMKIVKQAMESELVKRYKIRSKSMTGSSAEMILEVTLAKGGEDRIVSALAKNMPGATVNLVAKTGDTTY